MKNKVISLKSRPKNQINFKTIESLPSISPNSFRQKLNILTNQNLTYRMPKVNSRYSQSKTINNNIVYPQMILSTDHKNINLRSKVKEIRNKIKARPFDNYKLGSNILYSKDKVNYVFESSMLLTQLQKNKSNSLDENNGSISSFLLDNQEISINNLLIKLLKTENKKINNNTDRLDKIISDHEQEYKNNENNFKEFTENQKKYCSEINHFHGITEKLTKEQLILRENLKIRGKEIEEAIDKTILLIESYRTYAQFVNQVFNKDTSEFEKTVIPPELENHHKDTVGKPQVNYGEISKNIFKNYSQFLRDDFVSDPILKNPLKVVDQYNDLELKIIRMLKNYKSINDSIDKDAIEYKNIIKDLNNRYLEKENEYKSILNERNELYDEVLKIKEKKNHFNELQNLYENFMINICDGFSKDDIDSNVNSKKDLNDIIKESDQKIQKTEDKINNLLNVLELYEKNDYHLFYDVVNYRKNILKDDKLTAAAKVQAEIQNRKKIDAEKRFNKFVFVPRKVAMPFKTIKKEKNNGLNIEEIKNFENEQLIKY